MDASAKVKNRWLVLLPELVTLTQASGRLVDLVYLFCLVHLVHFVDYKNATN
jgi:hypothetical protein